MPSCSCDDGRGFVGPIRVDTRSRVVSALVLDPRGIEFLHPLRPHHKEIRALHRLCAQNGWSWDGRVQDDTGTVYYLDAETVRGNYPADCPPWLRSLIGSLVAEHAAGKDESSVLALRLHLALRARQSDYRVGAADLRTWLGELLPRSTAPCRSRHTVRPLTTLDLGDVLTLNAELDRARVLAAISLGTAVGVFSHTGVLLHARMHLPNPSGFGLVEASAGRNPDMARVQGTVGFPPPPVALHPDEFWTQSSTTSASVMLDKAWKSLDRAPGGVRCATCAGPSGRPTPVEYCRCARDPHAIADLWRLAASAQVVDDHIWGSHHAYFPTQEMRDAVPERAELIARLDPELVSRLSEIDPALPEELALYTNQVGVGEHELPVLLAGRDHIATLLETTVSRAEELHSDYTRALYAEFLDEAGSLNRGERELVFLGRDGIYPFLAWQEIRAELESRSDPRAESVSEQYLSVARYTAWTDKTLARHLPDRDAVFVDTGFSGSIPEGIARSAFLDLTGARPDRPRAHVRLLHTQKPGYGFAWQIESRSAALTIEHDAKPTVSARHLNQARPTGAIEQLLFRTLERRIRRTARAQAKAIFDLEPEGHLDLADPYFGPRSKLVPQSRVTQVW